MSKLKYTTEEFIEAAKSKHNNKYTYEKTVYTGMNDKIIVTCPKHGDFEQTARNHLRGDGCQKCYDERRGQSKILTTEEFVEKAKKVHQDENYDYSKVEYTGCRNKVIISCPKHGDFLQDPNHHLQGEGCPKCGVEHKADSNRSNTEEFIRRAIDKHGSRYTYDKVKYVRTNDKVIITCPIHGDFLQTPHSHLQGQGCPDCLNSVLEDEVRAYLEKNNFQFTTHQGWDWLVYKNKQTVDFFIPQFNMAIECQGPQHFGTVDLFDKTEPFELRWARDGNKDKLCQEHGIRIYYYSNMRKTYRNFIYPYQVYEDMEELMKYAMIPRLGFPDLSV